MSRNPSLRLLFIGNSHTYYNDMPILLKRRAEDEGIPCDVTMIAHPGWFLAQHVHPGARTSLWTGGGLCGCSARIERMDPRSGRGTGYLRNLGEEG